MNKNLSGIDALGAFDESGEINVIIETPKGSRNKYDFDENLKLFKLGGVLPLGAGFPFDFGFIPDTLGGDGDPLDVLLLMDEPAFTGCLVRARLIGVVEANQTERDGETTRNDRLIAVVSNSVTLADVKTLNDLNQAIVEQIKHFFVSYNEAKGKKFEPLGEHGARRAKTVVENGIEENRKRKAKAKK